MIIDLMYIKKNGDSTNKLSEAAAIDVFAPEMEGNFSFYSEVLNSSSMTSIPKILDSSNTSKDYTPKEVEEIRKEFDLIEEEEEKIFG